MKKTAGDIIIRPRITEKASFMAQMNTYTFEVSKEATKDSIKQAIKSLYKVSPVKVAIVKLPAKKVFTRGKHGKTASIKKAYVYLKKGDVIEIS